MAKNLDDKLNDLNHSVLIRGDAQVVWVSNKAIWICTLCLITISITTSVWSLGLNWYQKNQDLDGDDVWLGDLFKLTSTDGDLIWCENDACGEIEQGDTYHLIAWSDEICNGCGDRMTYPAECEDCKDFCELMDGLWISGAAYLTLIVISYCWIIGWIVILLMSIFGKPIRAFWLSVWFPYQALFAQGIGIILVYWIVSFSPINDEWEDPNSKEICAQEGLLAGTFSIIVLLMAVLLHHASWCFSKIDQTQEKQNHERLESQLNKDTSNNINNQYMYDNIKGVFSLSRWLRWIAQSMLIPSIWLYMKYFEYGETSYGALYSSFYLFDFIGFSLSFSLKRLFTKATYTICSFLYAVSGWIYFAAYYFNDKPYQDYFLPLQMMLAARIIQGFCNGLQNGMEHTYINLVCNIKEKAIESTAESIWETLGSFVGIGLCLATYFIDFKFQWFDLNYLTLPGLITALLSIIQFIVVLVRYKRLDYFVQALYTKNQKYKDYSDYAQITVDDLKKLFLHETAQTQIEPISHPNKFGIFIILVLGIIWNLGYVVRQVLIPFVMVQDYQCSPGVTTMDEICYELLVGDCCGLIITGLFAIWKNFDRRKEVMLGIVSFVFGFTSLLNFNIIEDVWRTRICLGLISVGICMSKYIRDIIVNMSGTRPSSNPETVLRNMNGVTFVLFPLGMCILEFIYCEDVLISLTIIFVVAMLVMLSFWNEMRPHASCRMRRPDFKHASEFRMEASQWMLNPEIEMPVYKDVVTINGVKYLPKKRYYVRE